MTFERLGAAHFGSAAVPVLPRLDALASGQPQARAGVRLHGRADLRELLTRGPIFEAAAERLGVGARPVRAILFDKSPAANWSLGWHQDRTIAVRERVDVDGFATWTVKQGILHVAPPYAVIEPMITVRVHLDDVPETNAPLLIAPGSHKLGMVPEDRIEATVARCGTVTCLAERGDIWIYATPILHASAAATGEGRRRVLQVDYAANELPGGLSWLGV